jgi:hypothetical protein
MYIRDNVLDPGSFHWSSANPTVLLLSKHSKTIMLLKKTRTAHRAITVHKAMKQITKVGGRAIQNPKQSPKT